MLSKLIKIGIVVLVIAVVTWLTVSYIQKSSVANNPKDLIETYLKYLGEGNYKAAAKLMTGEVKKETNKDKFTKAKEKLIDLYGKDVFSKVIVTVASITDNQAKVLVKLNGMNAEDLTFNLVKEKNDWKIGK